MSTLNKFRALPASLLAFLVGFLAIGLYAVTTTLPDWQSSASFLVVWLSQVAASCLLGGGATLSIYYLWMNAVTFTAKSTR